MRTRGFTLVELMIVIVIMAVLSVMGVMTYRTAVLSARDMVVEQELKMIASEIDRFRSDYGQLPVDLDQIGRGQLSDPWGMPYVYTNFSLLPGGGKGNGGKRKDRFIVPLNTEYDLFSSGPDRDWKAPLTAKASRDDFLRANDGEFYGWAEDY